MAKAKPNTAQVAASLAEPLLEFIQREIQHGRASHLGMVPALLH